MFYKPTSMPPFMFPRHQPMLPDELPSFTLAPIFLFFRLKYDFRGLSKQIALGLR